jgi:NAD(P)-dependent dehydrogenase (short-subunit alcohol dehydrogenase family)
MFRLANKTILITGGTTGIGFAAAQRAIEEGAKVAITGANAQRLEDARLALGGDVLAILADAGDVAAQATIAKTVADRFGTLDAVFVNAGVAPFGPLESWTEEAFDRAFDVNLKGPLFLVQALAPILSNPASIVFNGSINAHIGMPNSSVYAASKAGLISLARTLSGELIGRGIRVNVISPGPVATPLYDKLGLDRTSLDAMSAGILANLPAGRFGEPREIADAVVFLASDESRFTVGSELIIDGGMSTL